MPFAHRERFKDVVQFDRRGTYSAVSLDPSPVTLQEAKDYMRVTTGADDTLITSMIEAATRWGENYTGRVFRKTLWTLKLDFFQDPIVLHRDPVVSIEQITYLKDDIETVVDASIYYLVKRVQTSEIWLLENQEWPEDEVDERLQAIQVEFTTEPIAGIDYLPMAEEAILRTVAYWYRNRGDCSDCKEAAINSGVTGVYDSFRIDRV